MGIRRVFLLMACTACMSPALRAQYITLQGDRFHDEHGQPFFPMVMNYYVDYFYQGERLSFPVAPSPTEILDLGYGRSSLWSLAGPFNYPPEEGPQRLLQDFREMKAQGFNTVRMLSLADKDPEADGYSLKVKHHPSGQGHVGLAMAPPYVADIEVNPVVWLHFNTILAVCSLASTLDMKVIVEPVLGDALVNSMAGDASNQDHCAFLGALAAFMHAHEVHNLLAYEFFGEPTSTDVNPGTWHWKHDICALVRSWNSAVKSADPHHLTTVGGFFHDDLRAEGWDPILLDVDFASMHVYPGPSIYEWQQDPATFLEHATARYMNMIRHYDTYLKKPYIIMETSFSGEEPFDPDGVTPNPWVRYPFSCHGNEQDQDDFLRATFPAIRGSRCAGYGWWIFTNLHWAPYPSEQVVQEYGPGALEGTFYGILRFGDPVASPAPGTTGWEGHRKLAAQTLADWVDNPPPPATLPQPPASVDMNDRYYNPFMHPPNSAVYPSAQAPTRFGTLTGRVVDQHGAPVPGAVIRGTSFSHAIMVDNEPVRVMYAYYTYTDSDGWFELRAYDPKPGQDDFSLSESNPELRGLIDRTVEDMKIGAHGGEWLHKEPPFQQHATYVLNSLQAQVDRVLDGVTVSVAATEHFAAQATLTAQHMLVEGQADLVARYEVHLRPGFHAAAGSTMHAYTAPVFTSCEDISTVNLKSATPPASPAAVPTANPPQREVEIAFRTPSPQWDVELFPNPTRGTVQGRITGLPGAEDILLELRDAGGSLILQRTVQGDGFLLDLSTMAPGAYALTLLAGGQPLVRHIIRH